MTLVANIQVGNEVELIEQHIAYHLALGVDGFVIADMASVDGTSEILDRYRGDRRFVLRKFETEALINAEGVHTAAVGRWMLQATRDHFAPDWVIRMDADEFLYPAGDLGACLAALGPGAAFQIARRNVIFAEGQPIPAIPQTQDALAAFEIVAQPVRTSRRDYAGDDSLPLILTEVGPKVIARADQVAAYATGGHGTLDRAGARIEAPAARGLLLVHFWFTTPGRFLRKARFTAETEALLRHHPQAPKGWQWSRWAGLAQPGDAESAAAVMREYQRQFPDAARLDALRGAGVVCAVASHGAL
ncbi:glycosyltransferase family 2 protein [Rhodobacter capsulatus]|uniref:glycosyltransferase family 2 protein n=1 Tax=Rhodobacter capsulatus TaxID=1061 RepID=UPI0003D3A41E|nr:glycosyltransferase family 2 protein [Rhodobacter capsulatus]ETD81376.1 hypothetical protein U703_16320 [Rhodobacter capsulatus YW1]